jgi:hypothetical protein
LRAAALLFLTALRLLRKSLWRRQLADTLQGRIRQPGACPAALRRTHRSIGKSLAAAQGRSGGLRRSYEPEAERFADATPITEFRDAMTSNAPGFRPTSFLPHSTASPARRFEAAAAARLGVLSECQSACLSTPHTPKKPG